MISEALEHSEVQVVGPALVLSGHYSLTHLSEFYLVDDVFYFHDVVLSDPAESFALLLLVAGVAVWLELNECEWSV